MTVLVFHWILGNNYFMHYGNLEVRFQLSMNNTNCLYFICHPSCWDKKMWEAGEIVHLVNCLYHKLRIWDQFLASTRSPEAQPNVPVILSLEKQTQVDEERASEKHLRKQGGHHLRSRSWGVFWHVWAAGMCASEYTHRHVCTHTNKHTLTYKQTCMFAHTDRQGCTHTHLN